MVSGNAVGYNVGSEAERRRLSYNTAALCLTYDELSPVSSQQPQVSRMAKQILLYCFWFVGMMKCRGEGKG